MPEVGFVTVTPQAIPYLRDLPGRVAPMRIAEVRSRVSGLVVKRLFEQGSQVKEGDILYKIDPAPFEVELASAEAVLALRPEATALLEFVATTYPESANAQDSLADAHEAAGRRAEAIAASERALALLEKAPERSREGIRRAAEERLKRLR